ncbi:hypothetical protein [Halomontanus rarus]|uniref:hypothetical protein n=1 Tax=Halomontanus rarus TaxID=3034020 RepID=UPI0023E85C9D|nr:hypothetical protein [Halovivax sp. TS33]
MTGEDVSVSIQMLESDDTIVFIDNRYDERLVFCGSSLNLLRIDLLGETSGPVTGLEDERILVHDLFDRCVDIDSVEDPTTDVSVRCRS